MISHRVGLAVAAALAAFPVVACTPTPSTVTVSGPMSTVTVTMTETVTSPSSTDGPHPTSSSPVSPTTPSASGSAVPVQDMGAITLKPGERKEFEVGQENASSRVQEVLSSPPNEKVAIIHLNVGSATPNCPPGGCGRPQSIEIRAVAPGETTLLVTHMFNGKPQSARTWKIVVA